MEPAHSVRICGSPRVCSYPGLFIISLIVMIISGAKYSQTFNRIRKYTQKLTTLYQGLTAEEEGGEATDSNQRPDFQTCDHPLPSSLDYLNLKTHKKSAFQLLEHMTVSHPRLFSAQYENI